jgi:hypothetical protein
MRVEKKRREMPKGKKIAIAVALGLAALVVVFVALAITRERLSYAEARDNVVEILKTRETVVAVLDGKVESLEFDEATQKKMDEFDAALEKCGNYMTSLSASSTLKNEQVSAQYEKVKAEYPKIEKMAAIWADVKSLTDINDGTIKKLAKSQSGKLRELAEELKEYRAEMKNYKSKYDGKGQASSELIEQYSKMWLIGEDLNKKYEDISLKDVLEMSRDDILDFYATIEELNKTLAEK